MFVTTLPQNTFDTFKKISSLKLLENFYLSGGTALALQIGHRMSEDLDFFSKNTFSPEQLQQDLLKVGILRDVSIAKRTLNCFLENTQLQFLHYPYQLLEAFTNWQGICISSKLDIACTKLITISSRGYKKDFIDMYFLLKEYTLEFLFDSLQNKYRDTKYNFVHILKSLLYFSDADDQPMPRMIHKIDWKNVKIELTNSVKNFEF